MHRGLISHERRRDAGRITHRGLSGLYRRLPARSFEGIWSDFHSLVPRAVMSSFCKGGPKSTACGDDRVRTNSYLHVAINMRNNNKLDSTINVAIRVPLKPLGELLSSALSIF
jgi:hypothetical protein